MATKQTPPQVSDPAPADAVPAAAKSVTLRCATAHNQHLVGDTWEASLDSDTIALVEKGWVDVVELDGFTLPPPLA